MALAFLIVSLSMPRLVAGYGRSVLTAGGLIQLTGLLLVAAAFWRGWPHPSPWWLGAAALVCGTGQGLLMTPLFRIVLAQVHEHRAGAGSGILATTQQTAVAGGVATLGSAYLSLASSGGIGNPRPQPPSHSWPLRPSLDLWRLPAGRFRRRTHR